MTDSPFAQPSAGGDKFEPNQYNGRLLLIYPKSYTPSTTTKHGDSTSADVDVIVVDQVDPTTGQPFAFHNARLFGNLADSVRNDLGRVVLGRLGQGPNTKGNPPWILNAHSDAEAQMAGPIHQQYQAGLFKPKEQPQQTPAPGYGAPAAPPAYDAWAGMNASPAPPAYVPPAAPPPAAYAPPAAPAAPVPPPAPAAAAPDPLVAFLISKGLPPDQVAAMDAQTRQLVANSFPQ